MSFFKYLIFCLKIMMRFTQAFRPPVRLTHSNRYNLYLHEYQAYDLLKKYNVPLVPVNFLFISELQSQHS